MTEKSPAALITGAAKRLGREIALALAGAGYDIALHYHTSKAEAESTAAEIRSIGRACRIFTADLRDAGQLDSLAGQVFAAFPDCRVLVNNAAVFRRGPAGEADAALLDEHMAVNFRAPVLLTGAFAERAPKPACVVNLLDAAIDTPKHSYFYYLLSKRALESFTRMADARLAPGVRVRAVYPGVAMESSDGRFGADYASPNAHKTTPGEVARAVLELLEQEAV